MLLLVGIISSVLGACVWELIKVFYNRTMHKRPLMKFYTLGKNKNISVISSIKYDKGDEYFNYTVAVDTVYAYNIIVGYLSKLGIKDNSICFSEDLSSEKLDGNIFIIGGPKFNVLANDINTRNNRKFNVMGNKIVNSINGNVYEAKVNEDGQIERDYCLVVRERSIWNEDSVMILFSGIQHYGTIVGALCLNSKNIRSFQKENRINFVKLDQIEFVISANVTHLSGEQFHLSDVDIVDYYWKSKDMREGLMVSNAKQESP